MASSSRAAASAFFAGWRRVAGAPALPVLLLLATMAVTLPAAIAVRVALDRHLDDSTAAARVVDRPDFGWWEEFTGDGSGLEGTVWPTIIGAAAPVSTYSDLLDGHGPPMTVLGPLAGGLLVWLFLSGGVLERYARRRRLGTRHFFGACGVYTFRFVRLTVLTGIVYLFWLGPAHVFLFDVVYAAVTREVSVERTAFIWRVLLYLVWVLPLAAINLVVDYAKVRAVLEDRHSMIGALVAAVRFVKRYPMPAGLLYLANVLVAAVVLLAYGVVAPGARGGDWRLLAVMAMGLVYLLARCATRLAFWASAMALVEAQLAHREYTAAPLPMWPDSPAAEALENAVART